MELCLPCISLRVSVNTKGAPWTPALSSALWCFSSSFQNPSCKLIQHRASAVCTMVGAEPFYCLCWRWGGSRPTTSSFWKVPKHSCPSSPWHHGRDPCHSINCLEGFAISQISSSGAFSLARPTHFSSFSNKAWAFSPGLGQIAESQPCLRLSS